MKGKLRTALGILAIWGSIFALAQTLDADQSFAKRLWQLMAGFSGEDWRGLPV